MFYTQVGYMNNFDYNIKGLKVGSLKLALKC
jgi:hypothetical protein